MSDPWRASVPIVHFDDLFAREVDPFDLEGRWYERRKRAVTLAALEREHYPDALELACAEGALSELLAERCTRLVAVDGSGIAVQRAAARLAHLPRVTVEEAALPQQIPAGPFDLVLVAEVGYYLVPADLDALIRGSSASTATGGELVAVHWRHPSAEYPSDGERVHERFHALLDPVYDHAVGLTDRDFLLDSWRMK